MLMQPERHSNTVAVPSFVSHTAALLKLVSRIVGAGSESAAVSLEQGVASIMLTHCFLAHKLLIVRQHNFEAHVAAPRSHQGNACLGFINVHSFEQLEFE